MAEMSSDARGTPRDEAATSDERASEGARYWEAHFVSVRTASGSPPRLVGCHSQSFYPSHNPRGQPGGAAFEYHQCVHVGWEVTSDVVGHLMDSVKPEVLEPLESAYLPSPHQPRRDGGSPAISSLEDEGLDGLEALEMPMEPGVRARSSPLCPMPGVHLVAPRLPTAEVSSTTFSGKFLHVFATDDSRQCEVGRPHPSTQSPLGRCSRTHAWAPICTASHGLPSGGV